MAKVTYIEVDHEIIPSGEFPVVDAQNVQCVDERLDEVLREIGNSFETLEGLESANETNIATNTSAISGLDSRVTILEEQGGGGGTSDYTSLTNKPQINGNVLSGNKTSAQLGLASASDIPSNYITGGSQTSTSSADGGSNVFTFTNANGTTSTFTVKNGSKGSQGIQGIQGEKGEKGDTGATGATGSQGPKGDKGDTGAAGTNGTNGTNGTSAYWFTGTAVTGTAASVTVSVSGSKAGDMYLNTSTWNVYTATAANTWKYCCNIRGAAGQNATTTAVASKTANGLCPQLPNETTTTKYLRQDGSWQVPPNTTYSSKSAASGGTDVSLVTTGEKYTWNSKTSNTGTVTSVAVKMNGSTKGTVTSSGTIDLGTVITSHQDISGKQDKLTAGSNITINGSTISAKDTTYSAATTSANGLMSSSDKSKLDGIASGANNFSLPGRLAEKVKSTSTSAPDNITNSGFYYATAGGPFESLHTSNKDFLLICTNYSDLWASQLAMDFYTNNIAVRNKNSGTWNSWNTLASKSETVAQVKIGATSYTPTSGIISLPDPYFPETDLITIPNNGDLNNFTDIGNYVVSSGASSNTISNNPAKGGGFRMIVASVISSSGNPLRFQWIIPNNHDDILCYRRRMEWNGSSFYFYKWYSFGGNVVS